ncbi:MAG: hypothetical protein ABGY10_09500 [bacterium]|jgi:hypothetical protein|nr:hypothetical protein [Gemmatimonadota bacterium]
MTDISSTRMSPIGRVPEELDVLASELEIHFSQDFTSCWSDLKFEELALRAFSVQFQYNPVYRRFCESKNAVPTAVKSWWHVPMVPTTAFRHLDLVTGDHSSVRMVFRTSGTTSTTLAPGRHLVSRPSLYHASLLSNFREYLLPDVEKIKFVSLIPSPEDLPHSSLSHMVGVAADTMSSETHWFVNGEGVLNSIGLRNVLNDAALEGEKILLLGTAFAFLHWLDELAGKELRRLPPESRIMETGGFKAQTRDITKEQLYKSLSTTVGLEPSRIVNEYGMTELLSQLYESNLTQPNETQVGHTPPPWLRVRALNPTTLEPVAENETGLLAFFDLANLGSVCHVLTEDIGRVIGGKVHLEGRFPNAEPRGCSRAMDELMASSRVTRQ